MMMADAELEGEDLFYPLLNDYVTNTSDIYLLSIIMLLLFLHVISITRSLSITADLVHPDDFNDIVIEYNSCDDPIGIIFQVVYCSMALIKPVELQARNIKWFTRCWEGLVLCVVEYYGLTFNQNQHEPS